MKDWRGTEIVVGSIVAVIEKNRSYGKSGTHAAYGEVVRLGKKIPIVMVTASAAPTIHRYERAFLLDKVTVIGHVAPKTFGVVVPDASRETAEALNRVFGTPVPFPHTFAPCDEGLSCDTCGRHLEDWIHND
jgi:hypothetical protein